MKWWRRRLIIGLVATLPFGGVAYAALGDPSSTSNSYRLDETQVGGTGDFTSTSNSFRFQPGLDDGGATLGDTAVGNSASTNYQTNSGFNTTAQPSLTLIVNTGLVDLGVLSTSAKSTATATFSVKNYTSYGYVVQIVGSAPTNSGHALTALAADTASSAGTEQFGINLVRNNTSSVGGDPVQVPSSSFSYGVAGDGSTGTYGTNRPYTVPEKWRFASGETVASAPKSSGETDYTMTFMANISTTTPGGKYTGAMSIVTTGTY